MVFNCQGRECQQRRKGVVEWVLLKDDMIPVPQSYCPAPHPYPECF